MKFYITTLNLNEANVEASKIKEVLLKKGFIYDEKTPDVVISFGGDGTFLRSIQKFHMIDPLFVNINFGNLGYLCEYSTKQVDELLFDLLNENHKEKEVRLLECKYNNEIFYAINEFRVEALNGQTINFDVSINETFLERLKGDGCLISSSIGSSGMSRSIGGALVDNEIEMIQFVEKAPINNRFYSSIHSPYVLNNDKVIKIDNIKGGGFGLYFDCKALTFENFTGPLYFKISDKKIRFLKNERNNYIQKTREAFLHE